jgi:hypothetical protein
VGLYNVLLVDLECPQCQWRGEFEVEFKIGLLAVSTYRIGETLSWPGGQRDKPLRRPAGGNLDGEGYAECPNCGKDFWVDIEGATIGCWRRRLLPRYAITSAVQRPGRPGR